MDKVLLGEILALLMFALTIGAVLLGYPVAFTLAGIALGFAGLGIGLTIFDPVLLVSLPQRVFGIMTNEVLVAVPLFVFMGVMLERSRIAEALLETMGQLFGPLRGGLGISVILVGALLAASTGIVGATVVTMGLLSLPAMIRAGYDPKLAGGAICASGTLGQIIPPSIVLVFVADSLSNALLVAQDGARREAAEAMAQGDFSLQARVDELAMQTVSVGDLFLGALIPGLILVLLYVGWIVLQAILNPEKAPAIPIPPEVRATLWAKVLKVLVPPLLLIMAVLGSILLGLATPTEAASVGAVGAMLLAAANRRLNFAILRDVLENTVRISSMVFVILLGASAFALVFRGLGGEQLVHEVLAALPGGQVGAVLAVMALMFFLGFFLDTFEIIFIVIPITAPALLMLGVDPVWLGVIIGVNLQTSFLTPPFGFALFYLRGVGAKLISTMQIYRGAIPFVGLQLLMIAGLWAFPGLATWLPEQVFGPEIAEPGDLPPASLDDALFGNDDDLMPGGDGDLFGDEFFPE